MTRGWHAVIATNGLTFTLPLIVAVVFGLVVIHLIDPERRDP